MPELPEVELARRYLESKALLAPIKDVTIRDHRVLNVTASQLKEGLIGDRIVSVERHGKQLFLMLDSGKALTIHLGMTGNPVVSGEEGGRDHVRISIAFEDGRYLHYLDQRMFGEVGLTDSIDSFIGSRKLGPDALSISETEFVARVKAHRRPIKPVLLDQSVVAGLGNLYADEVLFQSQVYPSADAARINEPELRRMHANVRNVLAASLKVASDFNRLPDGFLLRDRKAGSKCPRDGGPLESMKVTGRTTVFCPRCQSN